eukprot:Awhi_evm1s3073
MIAIGECIRAGELYSLTTMLDAANATSFYTAAGCNLGTNDQYYNEDELALKSCTAPTGCSSCTAPTGCSVQADTCQHGDGGTFLCTTCEENKYEVNGKCLSCELRPLCLEPDMEKTGVCSVDNPNYFCKTCEDGYYVTESGTCDVLQPEGTNIKYIIGGVVGGVVLLLLIVALIVFCVIRRNRKRYKKEDYLDGMSPKDFVMADEQSKVELQTDEEYSAAKDIEAQKKKSEVFDGDDEKKSVYVDCPTSAKNLAPMAHSTEYLLPQGESERDLEDQVGYIPCEVLQPEKKTEYLETSVDGAPQ